MSAPAPDSRDYLNEARQQPSEAARRLFLSKYLEEIVSQIVQRCRAEGEAEQAALRAEVAQLKEELPHGHPDAPLAEREPELAFDLAQAECKLEAAEQHLKIRDEAIQRLGQQLTEARAQLAASRPYLQEAERIARQAHAGQKEESTGDDYIHHVERVVAMVEGDEAKAVAWLHDVLEDTQITERDLVRAGFSDAILDAVVLLTRDLDSSYADYMHDIAHSDDPLAIAVKVADLRDHLRPNCPERLRPRYERGLATLTPPPAPQEPK